MLASCLMPFLLALFFSLILEPPIVVLSGLYGSRRMAATMVFGAFVCMVLLITGLGVSTVFIETQQLLLTLTEGGAWLNNAFLGGIFSEFRDGYPAESLIESLFDGLAGYGLEIVSGMAHLLQATPSAMVAFFVTMLATYYLCVDPELPLKALDMVSPKECGMDFRRIYEHTVKAFSAYLRAQVAVMLVSMVIATIGLYLLGFNYILLGGVLVGVAELLPVLGPGTVLLPWAIFMLITGESSKCLGLIGIFVCITVVRQFVEPKVLGDGLGLHPLAAMAGSFIGLLVIGPFGLFVGPLVLSLVWMIIKESRQKTDKNNKIAKR